MTYRFLSAFLVFSSLHCGLASTVGFGDSTDRPVQVPGTWRLLPPDDLPPPKKTEPAIPRERSGQSSTLGGAEVRVAPNARTTTLDGVPGIRVDAGGVTLVFSRNRAQTPIYFKRMSKPPTDALQWCGSTFWSGDDPSGWDRIGVNWMHPGYEVDVVRLWVAPADGQVSISGRVRKFEAGGDGVRVSIATSDKELWSSTFDGGDLAEREHVVPLEVKTGDIVRFVVNRRANIGFDTTLWDPVVTYAGGAAYRASEGFSNQQAANCWQYDSAAATVLPSVPKVYGVGKGFCLLTKIDPKTAFPFVIVSDGNDEDGYGGYVIALDTNAAWTYAANAEKLQISGNDAAIVVRYDGTWIEGLKLLAACERFAPRLATAVRAEYAKATAGIADAPDLDLFLLAISEWTQDDDLFDGGDAKRLEECMQEQCRRTEEIAGKVSLPETSGSAWERYVRARLGKRSALLSDPKLQFGPLLFCTRNNPSWNHEVAQYFGWRQRPGGGLWVLERPGRSMACRDLLQGRLPQGSILEPRLSYDAKRIAFSFVETDGALDPNTLPRNETDSNHHYFHIYTMGSDGGDVRQITQERYDDLMPEWLPDGGIAFVSTRRRSCARCFWWGYSQRWHTYAMYRMNADGTDVQQLSWNDVNEWFPSVSNSGLLLFARWDYIDRDAVTHQNLWSMRPDGTNPMAVWGNESPIPHCTFQPRAIPGSNRIVCVASAHHAVTGGPLVMIDPTIDSNAQVAVTRLTPGHYPEAEQGPNGEWYNSPWPLSEHLFLTAYSRSQLMYEPARHNPDPALGLYVLDSRGNREVLYRDGTIGATCPTPLTPRPTPPVLTPVRDMALAKKGLGEMFLYDIYEGLPQAVRGAIKQIRVVQILPKTTRDANMPPIGAAGEENARAILGVVPVEGDGSARFLVPANRPILLQAIDADGFAYRTMRSTTSVMPGERVSCVGCHESRGAAPPAALKMVTAMKHRAAMLTPTPESGKPYGFVENIQPIFDAKCVACHSDSEPKGGVNLSRTVAGAFTTSYASLCSQKSKKSGQPLVAFFPARNQIQVTPEGGVHGARGSELIRMLQAGHEQVELTPDELRRIATWIDMNAVFYGVYEPAEQLKDQQAGKPVPMPAIQ